MLPMDIPWNTHWHSVKTSGQRLTPWFNIPLFFYRFLKLPLGFSKNCFIRPALYLFPFIQNLSLKDLIAIEELFLTTLSYHLFNPSIQTLSTIMYLLFLSKVISNCGHHWLLPVQHRPIPFPSYISYSRRVLFFCSLPKPEQDQLCLVADISGVHVWFIFFQKISISYSCISYFTLEWNGQSPNSRKETFSFFITLPMSSIRLSVFMSSSSLFVFFSPLFNIPYPSRAVVGMKKRFSRSYSSFFCT